MVKVLFRERIETMAAFAGIEQVIRDHGIARDAGHFDAMSFEDLAIVLDVLIDLLNRWVLKNRLDGRQHCGRIERRLTSRTTKSEIPRFLRAP
jgi:hypothetical protein